MSGNFGGGPGGGGREGVSSGAQILAWTIAHAALIAGVVVGPFLLVLAINAFSLWIGSRGVFVYLDNVVTGSAEIERPWTEHRDLANSLFLWRFSPVLLWCVAGSVPYCSEPWR